MFPKGINVLSLFSGIVVTEVALYRLDIPLKAYVQELNDDQLEQLMSRFCGFDIVIGSILLTVFYVAPRYALPYPTLPEPWNGHNGYNPDKENDRHGRSSNNVSRLEQGRWIDRWGSNLSGDAYCHQHERSDNLS
ncbi:hypothetical protein F3Y22_tig00111197pilonHSYRG00093 [Hibiscus syriacus]|uniref:Uncharacterized protein n=1 Tax=Hibiscus syriacus TaxID=106335 RepID=A0A6A2YWF1_HIBSY|nr:hypothetical protein F3Y22_tig00111197pilonHSYRG00093 [Hibiscus syriacus]